ncbi:cysteine desulfurase family protein [Agrobacterium pusense]|uniref:cysteine desulfurase family protein n=1 Tax=Agrobacterium pusense TaxID=648995 RepID=UPI001572A664|nr:cysteine desulfurase family protein [Agrobacterium pusense]NTE43874.1 cysteine desulfurase [Agrobacterium pusense]
MTSIYLDNQSTSPIDEQVLEMMRSVGFGNPHSSEHSVGWRASALVETAREEVASLIGADADEIFFTSGATEANNLAILGIRRFALQGKDNVARSNIEHKSVLAACDALADEYGFRVSGIEADKQGFILPRAVSAAIDERTALISVALVNNEIGTIQDIGAIRNACGRAILHCDAAQAPEAMAMKGVADLCDMLSLSAHKMRGPMGIGALYISRSIQRNIAPLMYGGGQQNGIRPGTLPVHLCVGMGAASRLAENNARERAHAALLRDEFINELRKIGLPFSLNGPSDFTRRHPGNANLHLLNVDADQLIGLLQPSLAISTGSACTSGTIEPSHVLMGIGLTPDQASSSIRISISARNKRDEVIAASHLIAAAIGRLQC